LIESTPDEGGGGGGYVDVQTLLPFFLGEIEAVFVDILEGSRDLELGP